MMKLCSNKCVVFILLSSLVLLIYGCSQEQSMVTKTEQLVSKRAVANTNLPPEKEVQAELLAGSVTPYYAFTPAAYEKALAEKKIILLYFYASWCPICKEEQQEVVSAFHELKLPNVIGFRVNYKDSDTDEEEVVLAKEFGIAYQHTKVILNEGKKVVKSGESWDTERYVQELNAVASAGGGQ